MASDDKDRELAAFDFFLKDWSRRDFLRRTGGVAAFSALSLGGLAAFLEACTNNTAAPQTSVTPVKGGHLTEAGSVDIGNFSAVNPYSFPASRVVIPMLFEPMYSFSPGGLGPAFASGPPKVSSDGLTYTVPIRKNVNWTDGKPLNADDVVFTFKVMYDPDKQYSAVLSTPGATLKPILQSVQASDPYTVVFKLQKPNAPFPTSFFNIAIWPQHVYGLMTGPQIQASVATPPTVTSGPFKFVEWVKGDHLTLARNDGYYGGPRTSTGSSISRSRRSRH